MPSFKKPTFPFTYSVAAERQHLRDWRDSAPGRAIPARKAGRLLLATWNIANLGAQQRRPQDHKLLAEIVSWFDLVAVQEVRDDLSGLRAILDELPAGWRMLVSDASGNDERLAFLYDGAKVEQLEKVGEIAIPPSELGDIKLPGVTQAFRGFDRNPYLAAFKAGGWRFLLVNVHLFFGSDDDPADMDRRALEACAVGRWADLRTRDKDAYARDIVALGDFNLPKVQPGEPVYAALRRRGLVVPQHSTEVGSNLAGDMHYDQIMFFPGQTQAEFTGKMGVFDFDGGIFPKLWQQLGQDRVPFRAYLRYYISDHRPLWAEFRTTG